MPDTFNTRAPGGIDAGPAIGVVAINYATDQSLTGVARGIYLTTAGTLAVQFADGSTATLSALAAGTIYPFAIVKILNSGSATAAGYVLF
jgi:hypothetical protein